MKINTHVLNSTDNKIINKTNLKQIKQYIYILFLFKCVAYIFKIGGHNLFGDDPTTEKWRLRRAFFKIHRMYFVEQPAVFLPAKNIKQITLKTAIKKCKKKQEIGAVSRN